MVLYRSEQLVGRDGFAQLLRAEFTNFRSGPILDDLALCGRGRIRAPVLRRRLSKPRA